MITKRLHGLLAIFAVLFLSFSVSAQNTVTGTVTDAESGETIIGATVVIKGTTTGTATDYDGKFSINTNREFPLTITISSVGFSSQDVEVASSSQTIAVSLSSSDIIGAEVVVSASRRPESILESPVSIEKMDSRAITQTPSANFYDAIENLKGVQMSTNSLTFKSINTRGFATFANVRFVQLIDNMDNAAPGLNFPAGNLVGISELDVNSVELLPGASSALYGANAFNGILFMNSKDPFIHTGLSAMLKGGFTEQESGAGTNPMGEMAIRYAKNYNDKFAFKLNFSALQGSDWWSTNYDDIQGRSTSHEAYDGINVYGDEIATSIPLTDISTGQTTSTRVARTGYREVDLIDDNFDATTYKFDAALHYRPFENGELSYTYKYGAGQSVYQGTNSYRLRGLNVQQHKVELKGDNYFVRAYSTTENAGTSYDTRFAAWNINRLSKSDEDWFTDYALGYGNIAGALSQAYASFNLNGLAAQYAQFAYAPGASEAEKHAAARAFADSNMSNNAQLGPVGVGALTAIFGGWNRDDDARYVPGTAAFETAKENITSLADLKNGSQFIDNSAMYQAEGAYNFGKHWDAVEILVGGSARRFVLNSEGTIFNDGVDGLSETIDIDEYAAYIQGSKSLMEDKLKLQASIRYDKSQNFDGNISPRASVVYTTGEKREHNFRGSFQTGFRNPDTQSQYIGLDLGVATLVGGTEENVLGYSEEISYFNPVAMATLTTTINGLDLYDNAYTVASATAFGGAVGAAVAAGTDPNVAVALNAGLLEKSVSEYVKPEKITAYEIGYKGILNSKLFVDFSVYYNQYEDFQANKNVLVPYFGSVDDLTTFSGAAAIATGNYKAYQVYGNATGDVSSWGAGLTLDYSLPQGYKLGGNYSYADFDVDENADPELIPGFNTPNHRASISFGNREVFKNFGFNVNYRWSGEYTWESTFTDSFLDKTVPSFNVLDAQVSYRVPSLKSTFKLGASNLLNQEYITARGSASIGRISYLSIVFDEMFK